MILAPSRKDIDMFWLLKTDSGRTPRNARRNMRSLPARGMRRVAKDIGSQGGRALRRGSVIGCAAVISATTVMAGPVSISRADPPSDSDLIRPLPVINPTASNWQPKFPFPYDQTRERVTDADVNAQREMCQWFNAQYAILRRQIDRLQFNRITSDGGGLAMGSGTDWDYSNRGIQEQVDIVTANIDQSVAFLAPRVHALTQERNYVGDIHFPLYQGKSFFLLWQHLSNVNDGIKARQPGWFTGPSVQRVKRWGSRIDRSNVCN